MPALQLQGDSVPTLLVETGDIVHLALWSLLFHETRCGVVLEDNAKRVDAQVNCMTCLTRADVFWIPLASDAPTTNHFNARCWLKQMHGPPCGYGYGYVTECCFEEDPCDYHKPKEPP